MTVGRPSLAVMTRPFSARVADPAWRHEVLGWLQAELVDLEITGLEQTRIRPWSTQLRLETSEGRMWLKANCPAQRFEPALQVVLSELAPESFDAPIAHDPDRGLMVTVDRGMPWGDQAEPGLDQWCELVTEAARVQQRLLTAGPTVSAVGLPDCSPGTVLGRFDRFVGLLSDLPEDHPSFLAVTQDVVDDSRRALERAVATLERSVLPVTWQHGDLHPWNVFVVDGRPRLFDLGDSQWAHAVEILCVPFGWLTERSDVPWGPVFAAYANAWDLTPADLADDWRAAELTQAVNRVLTWWTCLTDASAEEWAEWGDAPLFHLQRALAR